jgi:excisionase family DNA binding protein
MTDRQEWITTGEAARMLGVRSINTVKRLIRDGRLAAIRPGAHYRVSRADIERMGSPGQTPPNPWDVDRHALSSWAERHGVGRLVLFGSGARGELGPGSDIDMAFELLPGRQIGLFEHVGMRDELATIFRAPVDLGSIPSLRPRIRQAVEHEGVTLYAAR